MPCGGIYLMDNQTGRCWMCQKDGARHFVEEWDTMVHGACVPAFLQEEEGQLLSMPVRGHGHEVYFDPMADLTPEVKEWLEEQDLMDRIHFPELTEGPGF